ncbi:MAG: hypothetical protein ACRD45_16825 [Bryobacteraceae bacterium]
MIVVLVITLTGGGLNSTRVQVALQNHIATTSTNLDITWQCAVADSGDPAWTGLGCTAQLLV